MELDGKRVAYWLNLREPCPTDPNRYRVCLVTENEPGFSKMGNEAKGQAPWWWDEETCTQQNRYLGNNARQVAEIIGSSMRAQSRSRT